MVAVVWLVAVVVNILIDLVQTKFYPTTRSRPVDRPTVRHLSPRDDAAHKKIYAVIIQKCCNKIIVIKIKNMYLVAVVIVVVLCATNTEPMTTAMTESVVTMSTTDFAAFFLPCLLCSSLMVRG